MPFVAVVVFVPSFALAVLANVLTAVFVAVTVTAQYSHARFVTGFCHDVTSLPFWLSTLLCFILIECVAECGLLIDWDQDQSWS